MVIGPIHRERAAVHQNNDERLARSFQGSEERFFFRRKVEAGAIPTLEPGYVDLHLLALKLRRDADYCNHYVGLTRRGRSFETRIGTHRQPYQLCPEPAAQIFNLHRIAMPL